MKLLFMQFSLSYHSPFGVQNYQTPSVHVAVPPRKDEVLHLEKQDGTHCRVRA
jgi:hypothetical protein